MRNGAEDVSSNLSADELHGVKLDEINLNASDVRTNASAVEDKSKTDTSAAKGKTTIPKAEHDVRTRAT